MWNVPGGKSGTKYIPSAFVFVVCLRLVPSLMRSTLALAMAAPEGSTICPVTVALGLCASTLPANTMNNAHTHIVRRTKTTSQSELEGDLRPLRYLRQDTKICTANYENM